MPTGCQIHDHSIASPVQYPLCHYIRTHNHFTTLFQDYPGEPVPEENLLLDFMMQGKIMEADTPTIRLGTTSSGLISDPPPSSPIFTPDALPAATNLSCLETGAKYEGLHIQCYYATNITD